MLKLCSWPWWSLNFTSWHLPPHLKLNKFHIHLVLPETIQSFPALLPQDLHTWWPQYFRTQPHLYLSKSEDCIHPAVAPFGQGITSVMRMHQVWISILFPVNSFFPTKHTWIFSPQIFIAKPLVKPILDVNYKIDNLQTLVVTLYHLHLNICDLAKYCGTCVSGVKCCVKYSLLPNTCRTQVRW